MCSHTFLTSQEECELSVIFLKISDTTNYSREKCWEMRLRFREKQHSSFCIFIIKRIIFCWLSTLAQTLLIQFLFFFVVPGMTNRKNLCWMSLQCLSIFLRTIDEKFVSESVVALQCAYFTVVICCVSAAYSEFFSTSFSVSVEVK